MEMAVPDTVSALAIESACLELLVAAVRVVEGQRSRDGGAPRWLSRAVDYMHARCLESPTLAEISRVAGVHPAHLAREFRRVHKQSPASYVRKLRLDWAAGRLARTDESVAGLAAASGFADQSHFTRAFRRYAGVTPAAYRRDQTKRR
jgi:AraC family transcriptional regulator